MHMHVHIYVYTYSTLRWAAPQLESVAQAAAASVWQHLIIGCTACHPAAFCAKLRYRTAAGAAAAAAAGTAAAASAAVFAGGRLARPAFVGASFRTSPGSFPCKEDIEHHFLHRNDTCCCQLVLPARRNT